MAATKRIAFKTIIFFLYYIPLAWVVFWGVCRIHYFSNLRSISGATGKYQVLLVNFRLIAGLKLLFSGCSSRNFHEQSFVVKMAILSDQKCLLPTCTKSGKLNNFKLQAMNKLIECAVGRHDCEISDKLQGVLDSHGELVYVELHIKDHIKKPVSRKRKAIQADIPEAPTDRVRRS